MKKIGYFLFLFFILLCLSSCLSAEEKQEIETVKSAISDINAENPNEQDIKEARELYDALDENLKKKVGNYKTLTRAEDTLNESKIVGVKEAITKIDPEDPDSEHVKNAKALYDALDDGLKDRVDNYQILSDAENELKTRAELNDMLTLLNSGVSGCATSRDIVVTVWDNAIDNKYGDFNEALSALYRGKEYSYANLPRELSQTFKEMIEALNENYSLMEDKIEILKSLDLDKEVYSSVTDAFAEYTVFFNQIDSPSGSYRTFAEDTLESYNSVTKAITKLEAILP